MDDANLLGDTEMSRFLRDGFLVLDAAELGTDVHQALFDAACATHDEARTIGGGVNHLQVIGDNLRARIPALQQLLDSPTVQGALRSVLGDGFMLHPHHFVHEATPNDQSFHQDGNLPWNERGHYRSHRPNWAMLFYYPQAVTADAGPTEVLPGTQYWTTDFEKADGTWHRGDAVDKHLERGALGNGDLEARDRRIDAVVDRLGIDGVRRHRIVVPAGSIVLAHYDLMHRGTRTAPGFDGRRFMYKFYYYRTRNPDRPCWRNAAERPLPGEAPTPVDRMVDAAWHWLRGETSGSVRTHRAGLAARIVAAPAEDERVALAYQLGELAQSDADARADIGRLLATGTEAVRRNMAYAASGAGPVCAPALLDALANGSAPVRRVAAYALGEAGAAGANVVEALFAVLENDADDLARSNAAYALGQLARQDDAGVSAERLLRRLSPALERDNTTNGGMSRSTVRPNIVHALSNFAALGNADLEALATGGLNDHDRYVRGMTVALLERYALRDAIVGCTGLPYVEVHVTNVEKRGIRSVLAEAATGVIAGFGLDGYRLALDAMAAHLERAQTP
jgi:hypothetical protein